MAQISMSIDKAEIGRHLAVHVPQNCKISGNHTITLKQPWARQGIDEPGQSHKLRQAWQYLVPKHIDVSYPSYNSLWTWQETQHHTAYAPTICSAPKSW